MKPPVRSAAAGGAQGRPVDQAQAAAQLGQPLRHPLRQDRPQQSLQPGGRRLQALHHGHIRQRRDLFELGNRCHAPQGQAAGAIEQRQPQQPSRVANRTRARKCAALARRRFQIEIDRQPTQQLPVPTLCLRRIHPNGESHRAAAVNP